MLIIGAKGFAKELLEVVLETESPDKVAFYDDVTQNGETQMYSQFEIVNTTDAATRFFAANGPEFVLGLGGPQVRSKLSAKISAAGGKLATTVSRKATLGRFGTELLQGCNVMQGTVITNDVRLGYGCLVNLNCTIGHDTVIGDYVELCPGVHLSGNCKVGSYTFIGTNATVLPGVVIGKNVVIAAGALVNKDVPDNCMIAGVPGTVKKKFPEK